MKNSRLLLSFSTVNLIAVLIFVFKLPKEIIFKFNSQFVADQMIGRWFYIFMASACVVASLIILIVDIVEAGRIKHTYRYLVAFLAICVCSFYVWVMLGIQYSGVAIGQKVNFPVELMIFLPIAYALCINALYKHNKAMGEFSIFGYSWVKENPIVWTRTHKFAAKMSVLTAIIIFILALINQFSVHINYLYLYIILAWLIVYYLFTFIYARAIKY